MKKIVFSFFLVCSSFCNESIAQSFQQVTVEFEIDNKAGRDYTVLPMAEKGLMCMFKSTEPEKGNNLRLYLRLLNTQLEEVWNKYYLIQPNTRIIAARVDGDFFYVLTSLKDDEYVIMKVSIADGDLQTITYENIKNFEISYFEVVKSIFYFGGNVKEYPAIIRYDPSVRQQDILSSINQLKARIREFYITPQHDLIYVIMEGDRINKYRGLFINRYNLEGKLLSNTSLPPDRYYSFNNFRSFANSQKDILVFGSYALQGDDRSQGIYVMKMNEDKQEFLRFYDFGYLKNFFSYMKPKKQRKLERKIEKKRAQGKIKRLQYNLFLHDLMVTPNRIMLTAEVINPIVESRNGYPLNMMMHSGVNPMFFPNQLNRSSGYLLGEYVPYPMADFFVPRTKPYPEEFRYEHAFACTFDKSGNLLWDNSYVYPEQTEFNLPLEITKVFMRNDSAIFMQANGEILNFQTSYESQLPDSVQTITLDINTEEEIHSLDYGGLHHWYKEHFLISGIREVRKKSNRNIRKESFFISKLSYQPEIQTE